MVEAAADSSCCRIGFARGIIGMSELSVSKESRNSRCWERSRLCFQPLQGEKGRRWQRGALLPPPAREGGLEWEMVGWEPSTASHTGCVNSGVAVPGWAGFCDGQDSGIDRTPGQTHPACAGGSWSGFVPDSQCSSLNVTLAALRVCAL